MVFIAKSLPYWPWQLSCLWAKNQSKYILQTVKKIIMCWIGLSLPFSNPFTYITIHLKVISINFNLYGIVLRVWNNFLPTPSPVKQIFEAIVSMRKKTSPKLRKRKGFFNEVVERSTSPKTPEPLSSANTILGSQKCVSFGNLKITNLSEHIKVRYSD